MFRIFLLLFSFALSVFADDTFDLTENHFTMYVYGNVIPYYKVFQYIAMITKDGSLDYVLALGVTIVAYFAAKKAHEGDLLGVLKHTTWSLALAAFLLVPNSTLFIVDKRVDYGLITYNSDVQNNYNISYTSAAEVQHLPLAIAMGASAASIITSYVTEKIDETMSDVDGSDYMYTTYSNVGYGTPLKDILSSTKIGDLYTSAFSTDSNASKIARESLTYIGDCLIDKGLTTNIKYAKYLVGPNDDYINSLNYKNFGLSGDEKVTFDNEEVTCKELYDDISDSSNVDTLKKYFVARFKAMTHPLDMDDSSLEKYTTAVFKNLIDPYNMSAIGDFKQSMVNMAIGLSIPKLFQKYGIGLNGLQITQGVASEKSRMNLINEGLGSFNWMMKVIPQAMNILFVILIALYIPMALVAVVVGTDRGFKILTNYFFGLIAFKSIDIGLAVAHNVANYYSADSIGELYYGMGKNLFNVLNMPYFVGDAAQAAGLAGILGVAAVFITPTVIFWGETKAATGLIGAVKGMYAGTNPDLATAETAKFQGNLEYQEELSHNRGMKYIADRLGIDTAEGAKLYNQMQSEIDAINRGAAFGAIAGKGDLGNYAMGSYAKATVADFQTAGAGVVTNGTSIEAIRNGAFSIGAKGMAQTIGYGSEVHLNDAVISGMSNGIMEGAKDNYIGSHITTADARVLGTDSGVQMVAKAEGLLKATDGNGNHIYDSDGHLNQNIFGTGAGDKYIEGLEKQTANSIAKTAGFGSRGTMEDANKAGFYQGVQQAGSMEGIKNAVDNDVNGLNDLYQGAEREAGAATNKTIGTGEAILTDKNGNRISEQEFMGFIKAGAAKGFLAQGLAGEADLEKAFEPMGANGEKRLKGEYANGIYQQERDSIEKTIGAGRALNSFTDEQLQKVAEGGTKANIKGTLGRIEGAGGIDDFANMAYVSGAIQSSKQLKGTEGEIKKALMANGMNDKEAEKLAKAIIEGSKQGAEEFKKALDKIGEKAKTLTEAKEGSEYKKIGQYDSPDDFVKAQELSAIQQEGKNALKTFMTAINPETRQKLFENLQKQAKSMGIDPETGKSYLDEFNEQALKLGIAKVDKNNNIVATDDAEAWVKGRALAANSSIDKMFIGGMRMAQQYNSLGESIVNADASIKGEKGRDFKANLGNPQNMDEAITKEAIENGIDPRKWLPKIFSKGVEATSNFLQSLGFSKEQAQEIAPYLVATAGGTAGVEAVSRFKNLLDGKMIAKEDLPFKTLDGKEIKAGQSFNLKDIPKEHRFEAFKMSKIEPGSVGKFMNWAKTNLDKFGENFENKLENKSNPSSISQESSNKSFQKSINSSNTAQNQHSDKSPESKSNNYTHSQPPSNQSDLSINENEKNVNRLESLFNDNALNQIRLNELKDEISAKRPRKSENIEAKNKILDAIENDKPINEEWLKKLGYSKKEIKNRFEDLIESGNIMTGDKFEEFNGAVKTLEREGIKGEALKIGKKLLKYAGLAGAAYSLYDAGSTYKSYIDKGLSPVDAAEKTAYDITNGATFGAVDGMVNQYHKAVNDFAKGDYIQGFKDSVKIPVTGINAAYNNMVQLADAAIKYMFSSNNDVPMYNDTKTTIPISPVTANAIQQPSSGQDYHTAVVNQIFQAQATKNIAEAMNQFRDLYNPVAPVNGITIPTMGGELSIGNNNGYLQLGDYTTRVPMSDFRNYVAQHPEVAQTLPQVLATSGFNNENVYDKFGRGYEKMDNGQVESLLANMNYIQQTSTKDSQIGLGTIMDYQEKMVEILEENLASKEEKEIK
ncbi:conjugal transfer protein TraG N-terminal domain-containing protein [Caminibacter sp.]